MELGFEVAQLLAPARDHQLQLLEPLDGPL
jgi:hypothetical protein